MVLTLRWWPGRRHLKSSVRTTHNCSTATHGGPMASHGGPVSRQANDAGRRASPDPAAALSGGHPLDPDERRRWKICKGISLIFNLLAAATADWTRSGLWERAWARLLCLDEGFDKLNWTHLLADGSFSPAKKGESVSASVAKAKGPHCCC
ncbi:MAG: hypothetical protein R3B91_00390 [Planctomycetaceae bacterium]